MGTTLPSPAFTPMPAAAPSSADDDDPNQNLLTAILLQISELEGAEIPPCLPAEDNASAPDPRPRKNPDEKGLRASDDLTAGPVRRGSPRGVAPDWVDKGYEEMLRSQRDAWSAATSSRVLSVIASWGASSSSHVAAKPAEAYDCAICLEARRHDGVEPCVSLTCGHEFCLECLRESVVGDVEAGRVPVACPACRAGVGDGKGKGEGDGKGKGKVQMMEIPEFQLLWVLGGREKARLQPMQTDTTYVHCPAPDCPSSFQIPDQTVIWLTCPVCSHSWCRSCGSKDASHAPFVCCDDFAADQSEREARETREKVLKEKEDMADSQFEVLLGSNPTLMRRCPGPGCRAPIEKNGGCDHMKCTRCGADFSMLQGR
ncbi:hypothetical protein HK101_002352 [Irineochytrium annulatum]|nr:hypothetical protein HK101_002352 [Irineochytrium annulatum]